MYKNNKYRRGEIIYIGSLIMLGVFIVAAFSKVNHIINKVTFVKEAIALYEKQAWIEAEEVLQKAKRYKWFYYQEDVSGHYLEKLSWITRFDPFIKELEQELKIDYASKQYERFIELCESYDASGFKSLDAKQQDYLLRRYPVKEQIDTGYGNFKDLMKKALYDPVNNPDYIWAKGAIWEIPKHYFEEDKDNTVKELFIICDIELFEEEMSKEKSAHSLQNIMENMNRIYATNKMYGYESEWLTEKLKPYLEKLFKEKSSEDDIPEFVTYTKVYELNIISSYRSEKIEEMIDQYIEKMEMRALKLANNKNYIEAIVIYNALSEYRSYLKEIDDVNRMEKYDYKELLLSQAATQYSLIKQGRNLFGGESYVLGLNQLTDTLELVLVDGKRNDYTSKTYYTPSTQKEILDITINNNLIILRSPSNQRGYTYALIRFSEEIFTPLLSIEADAIEVVNGGESLLIKSPLGGFEGCNYEYIYTGDAYSDYGIISSTVSLDDSNFTSYEGKVITFDCYVPPREAGANALGMYYSNNTYYPNIAVSMYLENGDYIKSATYTIMGVYLDNVSYYNQELNAEASRPRIKILEINEKLGG